jgi:hypothetical protein
MKSRGYSEEAKISIVTGIQMSKKRNISLEI